MESQRDEKDRFAAETFSNDVSTPPDSIDTLTNVDERKLILKMDLRILPVLSILYIFAFIDRVNIGNAVLFGLREDLKISSNQYNAALCVFFVSYIVFEIPANLLLKKSQPHVFMTICMFIFGLLVVCQGFCTSFGGLVAIRFLLGIIEAGVFPGCFYIIGMWYLRAESQKRFSFFFNGSSLAGAFGGLLASAIGKLDFYNGHSGWKWIFWLEGGLTCILAAVAYFTIPDFPEEAKWLTKEERKFVIARLKEDQGESGRDEKVTLQAVLNCFKDWKMIPVAIMYIGPAVSGYALAYFIPTIVQTYGFSTITSQLYSVPPWASAFAFAMILAYFSDLSKRRFPYIIGAHLLALAGALSLAILSSNPSKEHFRTHRNSMYASLCLYLMGVISAMPIIVGWNVMNFEGHTKRAVGTAWQIGIGNTSGILSTWIFPLKDRPSYRMGYGVGIGCLGASLLAAFVYAGLVWKENRGRKADGRRLLLL